MTHHTEQLPAPTRPGSACASVSAVSGYSFAAVARIGRGFTITSDHEWITLRAEDDSNGHKVGIAISRDGIPALIAELQRLTYGSQS